MQECVKKSGSALHNIFITGESACESTCDRKRERITKSIASAVDYLRLHLGLNCDLSFFYEQILCGKNLHTS